MIRNFASPSGLKYFGLILICAVGLVVSSLLSFGALRLIFQGSLITLTIGLPIYFRDEWSQILANAKSSPNRLPVANDSIRVSKISSLFMAVFTGLVFSVVSQGYPNKIAELPVLIPVKAVNLPTGMSASFGADSGVKIVVLAPRSTWGSLNAQSFSATVDVANQSQGILELPVSVTSSLGEVKINKVSPERLTVTIEPIIVKTVPLVAKFSGQAGDSLVPDEPAIDPEKVEISGPKSLVENLTQVTVPIKLAGETKDYEQTVAAVALSATGEVLGTVAIKPAEAKVKIKLIKAGQLKTVGVRPQFTGQPASGYWLQSATVNPGQVAITGNAEALDKTTELLTQPIALANLSSETTVTTDIILPSGVSLGTGVDKWTVKLEFSVTSSTKTVTAQLVYVGLSSSLKVKSVTPSTVSAVVSGLTGRLNTLSDSDVKINLDLSAYKSAGTYSLNISNADFTLPDGIGLGSYLPSALDVVLEQK